MLMNRSSAFIARTGDPPSAFAASLKRYDGRRLVCGDQSGRTFPSSDLVRGRCQSYEASEVWLIPLASTCPVAWRYLMRHVSLHPSSFALPLWLRPRSSGHRHMPRQNRLRPVLRSRRKILGAPWRRKMARHSTSLGPLASLARSSVPGATGSPHDGQTIAGLAPQPRGRPHHAIAAARANEFDLGGIFQRMVGQSSPSANGASTWCLGFVFGGKVHVRPARSIFSNALNFRCSAIAAFMHSPCRNCPFRSPEGPPLLFALPCNPIGLLSD